MKNLVYLLLMVSIVFSLSSCEKEEPGDIIGMGNNDGELKVGEAFNFPQGIVMIGQVTGSNSNMSGYSIFGSGVYLRLKMTLLNTTSEPRTVFFPKGLLFKSDSPDYQNALLLQTTWINVEANSKRNILIDLYCLNDDLGRPDENGTYKILGISGSKTITGLVDLLKWSKINYEMIYGTFPGSKMDTTKVFTYKEISDRIQVIVHNLTDNGLNLSQTDKAFIDRIPKLTSSEIPQKDANSQYPTYFNEFIVSDKQTGLN